MQSYYIDNISALEAKFEAQKIAFAPVAFHVAKALKDFQILSYLAANKKQGLTIAELMEKTQLSEYALNVLFEFALSLNIIKILPNSEPQRYILGKTGYFLHSDTLTSVNMDFIADMCYLGLNYLQESLQNGKPEGLKVLGNWETVYEGLSSLPEKAQKSWFAFDHFYSDSIFSHALPIVFKNNPLHIMDIGCNTGKFTLAVMEYSKNTHVTMVDLDKQIALAQNNSALFPAYSERIQFFPTHITKDFANLPSNVDTVWMSQFLDCFSLEEIQIIMKRIQKSVAKSTSIFVLEPLWDKQDYPAATYSLQATSLYFTALANGKSKMYPYKTLKDNIEACGFVLKNEYHRLGEHDYSLMEFKAL